MPANASGVVSRANQAPSAWGELVGEQQRPFNQSAVRQPSLQERAQQSIIRVQATIQQLNQTLHRLGLTNARSQVVMPEPVNAETLSLFDSPLHAQPQLAVQLPENRIGQRHIRQLLAQYPAADVHQAEPNSLARSLVGTLKYLDLSGNELDSLAVAYLTRCLVGSSRHLEQLNLRENPIGVAGVQNLLDAQARSWLLRAGPGFKFQVDNKEFASGTRQSLSEKLHEQLTETFHYHPQRETIAPGPLDLWGPLSMVAPLSRGDRAIRLPTLFWDGLLPCVRACVQNILRHEAAPANLFNHGAAKYMRYAVASNPYPYKTRDGINFMNASRRLPPLPEGKGMQYFEFTIAPDAVSLSNHRSDKAQPERGVWRVIFLAPSGRSAYQKTTGLLHPDCAFFVTGDHYESFKKIGFTADNRQALKLAPDEKLETLAYGDLDALHRGQVHAAIAEAQKVFVEDMPLLMQANGPVHWSEFDEARGKLPRLAEGGGHYWLAQPKWPLAGSAQVVLHMPSRGVYIADSQGIAFRLVCFDRGDCERLGLPARQAACAEIPFAQLGVGARKLLAQALGNRPGASNASQTLLWKHFTDPDGHLPMSVADKEAWLVSDSRCCDADLVVIRSSLKDGPPGFSMPQQLEGIYLHEKNQTSYSRITDLPA